MRPGNMGEGLFARQQRICADSGAREKTFKAPLRTAHANRVGGIRDPAAAEWQRLAEESGQAGRAAFPGAFING
jgi:hypothetical protein